MRGTLENGIDVSLETCSEMPLGLVRRLVQSFARSFETVPDS